MLGNIFVEQSLMVSGLLMTSRLWISTGKASNTMTACSKRTMLT